MSLIILIMSLLCFVVFLMELIRADGSFGWALTFFCAGLFGFLFSQTL